MYLGQSWTANTIFDIEKDIKLELKVSVNHVFGLVSYTEYRGLTCELGW